MFSKQFIVKTGVLQSQEKFEYFSTIITDND